jgi:hypothetical protein
MRNVITTTPVAIKTSPSATGISQIGNEMTTTAASPL